jgi:hypothetical protein
VNRLTASAATASMFAVVFAVAGCAGQSPEPAGPSSPAQTTTASAATTSSTPLPDFMDGCGIASAAAGSQNAAEATALVDNTDSGTLRAQVAASYRQFATNLIQAARLTPTAEATALTNWATAGETQADYIVNHAPPPGDLIDYGPPKDQLNAAKQAAEKVCGRKLGP